MTDDYFFIWQPIAVSLTGLGAFGWAMYQYPGFRRNTIQGVFKSCDYVYDAYHHWRYDDKIRQTKLMTQAPSEMVLCNSFHLKSGESDPEEGLNELLNFASNSCSISQVNYKEQTFYLVHNDSLDFTLDNVLSLPWLAVSLKIGIKDDAGGGHEVDITDKLKQFWLNGNILPFHLEYYDLWIKEFVPHLGKDQIEDLELVVIDDMGNFKNHKNVLIRPHHESNQIDLIPLRLKSNLEGPNESEDKK